MLLSVTAANVPVEVPPERVKATTAPPTIMEFPAASFADKVATIDDPEVTVFEDTLTKEVNPLGDPGLTVMVGKLEVTAVPPMVAEIFVGVPDTTPVKVAV